MWTRPVSILAAMTAVAAALPAAAQGFRGGEVYGSNHGYAGDFVRGTYVGAPLTRVPRPSQIVPSPWSYGTYGIPTVSGIPATPAGQPTLTVINARGPQALARRGEPFADGDRAAGVRVIEVQVPRR